MAAITPRIRLFVRPLPIALGVPPQSGEGVRQPGWRRGRGERLAKFVQGHSEIPAVDSLIVSWNFSVAVRQALFFTVPSRATDCDLLLFQFEANLICIEVDVLGHK